MKIVVIKLGAKGDVIRTLPILLALKEKFPDSEITWITKPESKEILTDVEEIDKILTTPCFPEEKFDILYNFDIEDEATELASNIEADKKYGFYKKGDYAATFNFPAEYYLNTFFDDELKKTNKKPYQQMMFEAAELPYNNQHYSLSLKEEDKNYAKKFAEENNLNTGRLIGIHMGAGERWPSKAWSEEKIKEFIIKAKEKGYEILFFGGPKEIEKHIKLSKELKKQKIQIFKNNPKNSDKEFASLINLCKAVICSDSYALHISLSLKKPTIALFFCTSPHEVEDYSLLYKIASPLLYNFFPEKSDLYNEELVNSISVEQVLDVLGEIK